MINTEYPIDAVVTWVDGNGPAELFFLRRIYFHRNLI